jgi:hypothetical protein
MRYQESVEQKSFVDWFKLQYPHYIIMHIPNGQNVGPVIGRRLKAMGLLAGAPDIFVAASTATFNGLFIEMKTTGGKLAQHQADLHNALREQNYRVEVCWDAYQAIAVTQDYFKSKPG